MRKAELTRDTNETKISVSVDLDGTGEAVIQTGVGFFDHMLTQIARHGLFNITVQAKGDLEIDAHHTVEDIGICLGKAFVTALGDTKGLTRYGSALIPLDEALAEVVVDVSGRPFLSFNAGFPQAYVGEFDVELVEEFFRGFAVNSRTTLHANLRYGSNTHHCIEAMFKALARALRQAVTLDPRVSGVPSSKGMLEI